MNEKREDPVRMTGPEVRWRTWSRETRPLRLLIIVLTLDWSVSGLTLKRTMCSMVDDMVGLAEKVRGVRRGRRLGAEKVMENVDVVKKGRARIHSIV